MSDYQIIDVIEVTPDELKAHAGREWAAVVAEAEQPENSMTLKPVRYWSTDSPQKGHAFLRSVDGRAFLYLQRW